MLTDIKLKFCLFLLIRDIIILGLLIVLFKFNPNFYKKNIYYYNSWSGLFSGAFHVGT